MRINMFNIEDFVKVNQCPQVTNPIFFNFDKTPTSDGLFSYDLFGVSDKDRKNIFGYIDLRGYYINPLIYTMMSKRMGSLKDLLAGEKYAIIKNKKIMMVPENYEDAETGIDFIYNNFEKINWIDEIEEEEIDSIDKKTRLKFLKSLTKEEFFVSKWLVLPPFYRAESSENRSLGDEVNSLYKDLISRTNSMSTGFGLSMFGNQTKFKIQTLLIQLFEETTKPVKGKGSMLRKHLLGKTIDYTSSNVITSPPISSSTSVEDMPVRFGYGSFPIATVVSLFHPFFVTYISEFLGRVMKDYIISKAGEDLKYIDLTQFSSSEAEKIIKAFIKSEDERFSPIKFEFKDKSNKMKEAFIMIQEYHSRSDMEQRTNAINREMSFIDLFYLAAKYIIQDKHVYITRYPVISFKNIYPAKIKLLTTTRTRKDTWIGIDNMILNTALLENKPFDDFPYVKFEGNKKPAPSTYYNFLNVFIPGNIYLKALDGDYDGDMLYLRGLFTKEANAEADKLIYAKSNFLTANGSPSRGISKMGKDAIISLFEMTKEKKGRKLTKNEIGELLSLKNSDVDMNLLKDYFAIRIGQEASRFNTFDTFLLPENELHNDTGIETTIGRYIFNFYVIPKKYLKKYGYQNITFDGPKTDDLESNLAYMLLEDQITNMEYIDYLDRAEWITMGTSFFMSPTMNYDITIPDPEVIKLRDELFEKYKKEIEKGDPNVADLIEKQLLELAKKKLKESGNESYDFFESSSIKKDAFSNNFKKNSVFAGALESPYTKKIKILKSNYVDGISKDEFHHFANLTIIGGYSRNVETQKGGYQTKKINNAVQNIVLDDAGTDCGTDRYLKVTIPETMSAMFLHRYARSGNELVLLDEKNIKSYMGREIQMRSPLFCKSDHICSKCAGELFYKLDMKNAGLLSTTMSGSLMNMSMKKFHDTSLKFSKIDLEKFIKEH